MLLLSTVNSFLLEVAGLHKVEKWKLFASMVASLPGLFPTLHECHPLSYMYKQAVNFQQPSVDYHKGSYFLCYKIVLK